MIPLAVLPIAKGAIGAGQLIAGALKKPKQAYIPPALQNELAMRKNLMSAKNPMQDIQEQQIKSSTATALGNVKRSGAGVNQILAATAGLTGQEQKRLNQLSAQQQQFQMGQQEKFLDANRQVANLQNKYRQEIQEAKRGLIGAGLQNIIGASTDAISASLLSKGGVTPTSSIPPGGTGIGVTQQMQQTQQTPFGNFLKGATTGAKNVVGAAKGGANTMNKLSGFANIFSQLNGLPSNTGYNPITQKYYPNY